MPFTVAQVSSVMMSSPSPTGTNGAQDLHENLLCIGDAGLSYQNELNRTVHWQWNFVPTPLPSICHLEYKNKMGCDKIPVFVLEKGVGTRITVVHIGMTSQQQCMMRSSLQ